RDWSSDVCSSDLREPRTISESTSTRNWNGGRTRKRSARRSPSDSTRRSTADVRSTSPERIRATTDGRTGNGLVEAGGALAGGTPGVSAIAAAETSSKGAGGLAPGWVQPAAAQNVATSTRAAPAAIARATGCSVVVVTRRGRGSGSAGVSPATTVLESVTVTNTDSGSAEQRPSTNDVSDTSTTRNATRSISRGIPSAPITASPHGRWSAA